jgi:hypothetical protein
VSGNPVPVLLIYAEVFLSMTFFVLEVQVFDRKRVFGVWHLSIR